MHYYCSFALYTILRPHFSILFFDRIVSCLLYQFFTVFFNFYFCLCSGQYTWPESTKSRYPPTMLDLADSCMRSDAAARPTAAQLLEQIDARTK